MRILNTTNEIISALGGPTKLARALGLDKRTVSGWWRTTIPSRYRDVMADMLANLDEPCTAPASLWGMVEPKPVEADVA